MTRPLKLAIIGGGPCGFYLASRLLSRFPQSYSDSLRIHIFDRLWAPHGLVRYGVAPDHPEVKNCTHKFDAAASDSRLRFFGNVNVTSTGDSGSLSLSLLKKNYTHLAFATGCTEPNMHPQLPRAAGIIPALDIVHWYTRHPSNPTPPPLNLAHHVSIIGMGNVSLDVARMLLCPPSLLEKYDVPSHVLDTLKESRVKHVSVIGRRGPLEAAFTTKELREMMNLPDVALQPLEESVLDVQARTRQQSRTLDLLKKGSQAKFGTTLKSWSLDFYRNPIGVKVPDSKSPSYSLSLGHTVVDPITKRAGPLLSSEGVPLQSHHPTSLIVTAMGFHAEPSPTAPYAQWYDFDQKHIKTLPGGRVSSTNLDSDEPKMYASGWAATGAKGVLASTMMDAYSVAEAILEDWTNLTPFSSDAHSTPISSSPWDAPPPDILEGLSSRDTEITTYEDWLAVDAEEVRRASAEGKERERMDWNGAKQVLYDKGLRGVKGKEGGSHASL
ncbi:ferredoxin adrenodoxin reductase [Lentinula aciculospora]|uniref:NADPH:adrenodoxin oxidoreductase, mitochondrial n=1 Tax=Lentinula aciculospora TaxID=153920 RepID=A0A9W9ALQ9_9AGAR|nr:ferredoxin adrenodoxin reductase [Lentinula aciculospora]